MIACSVHIHNTVFDIGRSFKLKFLIRKVEQGNRSANPDVQELRGFVNDVSSAIEVQNAMARVHEETYPWIFGRFWGYVSAPEIYRAPGNFKKTNAHKFSSGFFLGGVTDIYQIYKNMNFILKWFSSLVSFWHNVFSSPAENPLAGTAGEVSTHLITIAGWYNIWRVKELTQFPHL